MFEWKLSLKKLPGRTMIVLALMSADCAAQASIFRGARMDPMIVAGAPPDSPGARVDANLASSPFSGVVSLQIIAGTEQFICSGALVGKRSVVSAGHCVDVAGDGVVIDLKNPANAVNVVFNASVSPGTPGRAVIGASAVSMHKDYQGFGVCPAGAPAGDFCVNDDIAVVTLGSDAPADAKIYKVSTAPVTAGTRIMMAGYGTSGDGIDGYYVDPAYRTKRTGQNYMDLYDGNDEAGYTGKAEVYYADFDGGGIDTFCTLGLLCSPQLPNDIEANIGGGDSGGPSFIHLYGEMVLVANNTFGNRYLYNSGTFGTYFGGIVLGSYAEYLAEATGGRIALVPEPSSLTLFGLACGALCGARRLARVTNRRKATRSGRLPVQPR